MAKSRKPNSARKPPVPSDAHAEIEGWTRRVMPDLHPIVERLDELIRDTIDGLQYAVKWKRGTGRDRYVKVKALEEAQGPEMREWIGQAGRLSGWE